MNAVGFASTYSLVDLLDELPLPKALNLKENDRLVTEPLDIQNVQELQDIAAVIAPAIQMARLPSDIDKLRFKESVHCPTPNMRNHHAQASPLMSLVVSQHQQFQDVITVPPYHIPQQQQQPLQIQAPRPQYPSPTQYSPTIQSQPSPAQHYSQPPTPQQHIHHPQALPQQSIHPQQMMAMHQQQHSPHQQQPPHHRHHLQQQQMQHSPHHMQIPPSPHPPPRMTPPQVSPSHPYSPVAHQYIPPHPQQIRHQQAMVHQPQVAHQHPSQMIPHPSQHAAPMPTNQHHQQPQHPQHPHFMAQPHQHQQPHHHQHPQQIPQMIPQQPVQIPQQAYPRQHHIKQQTPVAKPPRPSQNSSAKKKSERERQREREKKLLRPEIQIDTRNSSLEEVMEKFLQETISEQVGNIADANTFYNFTPKQLLHLVAITAKLKKKNRTKNVNLNKLTSLMTTLSSQLQVQTEVLKNNSYRDDSSFNSMDSGDEAKQNGTNDDQRMQKFETCCDCAVVALHVMTSSNMDSRVYLEECVEAIINFVNTALTIITDTASGNFCPSPKKPKDKQSNDRRPTKKILFEKNHLAKLNAKCSEVLSLVNDLLNCRTEATLNDSLLLSTSRAALTAFFLMDSSTSSNELQLNALNVITAIFASYKNHQTVILDELIHSIARLPTSKRNRVPYQIGANNSESISIFSALIMKLIQSLFTIRKVTKSDDKGLVSNINTTPSKGEDLSDISDYERLLKNQYNSALRASYAFLSSFLRRCCGVDKKDDCDYRVLFETFVEDLMTCLYKPDWSSAQLITHVLIKLLIANINPQPGKKNQQATNQTLKLASLEHLGTICARLIKEKSYLQRYKSEVKRALNAIDLSSLPSESRSKRLRSNKNKVDDSDTEEDETKPNTDSTETNNDQGKKVLSHLDEQKFWLALLTFCQREKGITKCGRNIFCAIWLKELERRAKHQYELNNPASQDSASISDDEESNGPQSNNSFKQYSRNNNGEGQSTINGPPVEDIQAHMVTDFFKLLSISARRSTHKGRDLDVSKDHTGTITPESADEDSTIDESTAENIIKLLDVSLPTTQRLIDAALSHIMAALSSTASSNIRTKATKSLSHILNDAPMDCATKLLARDDLQKAIGASLLDQSILVRDSTIELIGRFILNSQSDVLIDKYYDMLTNRIMDSGVAVRKRVIKILRDICIMYPTYSRVPEICSIIIKRINDEGEGIRKLVSETFTTMWFKEERTHEAIVAKVACITHVVATVWSKILAEANKNTGTESHFEWLHQLLSSLLKVKNASDEPTNNASKRKSRGSEVEPNEDGEVVPQEVVNVKQTLAASTQIISVLVSEKLSNGSQESNSRADCLAAMTALWSFAKISPLLLTHHLDLFQSFLNIDPKSSFDLLILEKVIQIIELILPSISNPGVLTMKSIEANLAKLIIRGSIRVISVSVSCLSELIHRHTRNEELANDTFKRFLGVIRSYKSNPNALESNNQALLLRALYTCGLLAKHFNIEDRDVLYTELVHFVEVGMRQMSIHDPYQARKVQDERILLRSLEGLGFMFERTPSHMLRDSTIRIYRFFMRRAIDLSIDDSAIASACVLNNLRNYLQDEVTQEIKSASSIDWSRENLKEMTSSKQEDANSIQSSVIQLYLRDMLSCALSSNVEIRKAAIKLIHSVHNGGHINPLSIVPSLIALSSDDDSAIRVRADHVLQEIERKYSNFVNMKSKQGVLESFILNRRKRGYHRLDLEKQTTHSSLIGESQSNDQVSESQSSNEYVNVSAKLSTLYTVVASTNRQQRRAFINALLRYFDLQTLASAPNMLSSDANESRFVLSKCTGSDILLYVSDNLMFLPFNHLDEPFFLIHQIGITMSNLVSQAVSQFREILQLSNIEDDEVEDEDIEINDEELSDESTEGEVTDEDEEPEIRRQRKLFEKQARLRQRKLELRQRRVQQRGLEQNLINAIEAQDNINEIDDLPVSVLQVKELVSCMHRCVLMMHCRRAIWDLYGITDQKFEDYTPNESTKVTDKPTHRRQIDEQAFEFLTKVPPTTVHFNSEPFIRSMYSGIFGFDDDNETAQELEQCAPNRYNLKLEYKRFLQMITK